jgi:signal peptidase I
VKPSKRFLWQDAQTKPVLFTKKGDELSLSGPALAELLTVVLDKGVPFRFRAKGLSMSPFILDGDLVTVSPMLDSSPRPGDVGAFVRPETGTLIVHRVVKRKGQCFLVKGDNTSGADGLIPEQNILGLVTMVERNGNKVLFGLGLERFLISFLSRRGWFCPLVSKMRKTVHLLTKRLTL